MSTCSPQRYPGSEGIPDVDLLLVPALLLSFAPSQDFAWKCRKGIKKESGFQTSTSSWSPFSQCPEFSSREKVRSDPRVWRKRSRTYRRLGRGSSSIESSLLVRFCFVQDWLLPRFLLQGFRLSGARGGIVSVLCPPSLFIREGVGHGIGPRSLRVWATLTPASSSSLKPT